MKQKEKEVEEEGEYAKRGYTTRPQRPQAPSDEVREGRVRVIRFVACERKRRETNMVQERQTKARQEELLKFYKTEGLQCLRRER